MNLLPGNDAFWRGDDCFVAVNSLRPHEADGLSDFAVSSDDLRSLLFFQTSGSEGSPKWVGLLRAAFLASARSVNAHLEATSRDHWLIALPLYHVGGFSILARCHENGAGFFHWQEKWDVVRFAEVCAAEKISLTSLVPTQVFDLVQAKLEAPPSLRAIIVGGGSLEKDLGTRARALGWRVLQSYGMTETASQIATEPLDHLLSGFDPDRLEVLAGWNLQCDADDRLIVRGEALALGYALRDDGAWRWASVDPNAGLITRDRVKISQHGAKCFLQFLGRDSDFVKVLGELVCVSGLQTRLERLLESIGCSPTSAIIWPATDARRGVRLLLVGELPLTQLEQVCEFFNLSALRFERLEPVRELTTLPRTSLGKLDRAAMGRLLSES